MIGHDSQRLNLTRVFSTNFSNLLIKHFSNYINLLTRIRLEENKVKEKEPSNLLIA
ncbi:transposase [Lactobacillus acetotolerans]|uniref:Transposase n=1 Tax=Lactobacillus acetotolerans TaxID=1600 RepID=A0A0D6A1N3_9LACO|nr:transposase [Lactobacillus acetotolerans]